MFVCARFAQAPAACELTLVVSPGGDLVLSVFDPDKPADALCAVALPSISSVTPIDHYAIDGDGANTGLRIAMAGSNEDFIDLWSSSPTQARELRGCLSFYLRERGKGGGAGAGRAGAVSITMSQPGGTGDI